MNYIFFELNYEYFFCIIYKKNVDFDFKSKTINKVFS